MDKPMVTIPLEEYYNLRTQADAYMSIQHLMHTQNEIDLLRSNMESLYRNLDDLAGRVREMEKMK